MKKFLAIIILLLVIAMTFGYSFLKISANGDEDNYFNTRLRGKFVQSRLFRDALGLHYDGDAKGDFLGNKYGEIEITVLPMEGFQVEKEILDGFVSRISRITGKKTTYKFGVPLKLERYSSLDSLEKDLKSLKKASDKARLYFIMANTLEGNDSRIGSTLMEDGVVFFQGTMLGYAGRLTEKEYFSYAQGVLLHEFGHQLGLGHNQKEGCLMNPVTEFTDGINKNIIDDFCEKEVREIENTKSLF